MNKPKRYKKTVIIVCSGIILAGFFIVPFIVYFIGSLIADPLNISESITRYEVIYGWRSVFALKNPSLALMITGAIIGVVAIYVISQILSDRHSKQTGALKDCGPVKAGHNEHGSANLIESFNGLKEISETWRVSSKRLLPAGGCPYGYMNGHYLFDSETIHTGIFAPSGMGKTRRVTIPLIHLLASAGESMVIFDPKLTLYTFTSQKLKDMGYHVYNHDWAHPHLSNQWNQLDSVTDAYLKSDLSHATLRAGDLAYNLIPPEVGRERFWSDISRALLESVILLVATSDIDRRYKTMSNVKLNLIELKQLAKQNSRSKKTRLDAIIDTLDYFHPVRDAYSPVMTAQEAGQLTASIYATATTALKLEGDPNIAGMSQTSDYNLASIGMQKTAVFLSVPSERQNYAHYPVIYLQQAYEALAGLAKETKGSLPVRTNFILEELGQTPEIMGFAQKIAEGREYDVRFFCFLQAVTQLNTIYGHDMAKTILENLRAKIFLGTGDPDTAKYFESLYGRYTIQVANTSKSTRRSVVPTMEGTDTASSSFAGRPLIMADELQRWHPDKGSLVFRAGYSPACYPCPDLTKTPANAFFNMGSRKHNSDLYQKRMEEYLSSTPDRPKPAYWIYDRGVIKEIPHEMIPENSQAISDQSNTKPSTKPSHRRGKRIAANKQTSITFDTSGEVI